MYLISPVSMSISGGSLEFPLLLMLRMEAGFLAVPLCLPQTN